jgi:hypothetical protein
MRPWIGCAVVIFLAACSGATPSGFGSAGGDDSNGNGSGDNGADGGTGSSTGNGGDGGGGTTPVPPAPTNLLAGASVSQVNVYQGSESVIVQSGAAATPGVALVAGRPALFRIFVTPGSGFAGGNVTAQLRFEDAGGNALDSLSASASITAASTESDTNSTINFTVPATDIVANGKYSVALVDSGAPSVAVGTANPARFPQDGTTAPHGAKTTGGLKITLVPVITSGGSPPDTSATQLQTLHDVMFALYPVTDVTITVHSTYNYNGTVSGTSSQGYEDVLEAITNLRQSDNPPDDVYYWGTFDPKSTFAAFCGGGCIAGLSTVDEDASDAADRVSTGIGYTGTDTAFTMAHEVGHAHGRNHAPGCGASGIDPSFPSAYDVSGSEGTFGSIGIPGYDLVNKVFEDPSQTGDVMGYCPPTWVSDYTYNAFFTRVQQVNGAADVIGNPLKFTTPQPYRFVNVYDDGTARWGQAINMRDKPTGNPDHTVTYLDANGKSLGTATAHLHRFDHSNGGYLLVPEGPAGFTSIRVVYSGAPLTAGRVAIDKTLLRNF